MHQFFKRLLWPLAVAVVTQTSIVYAEGIRLIGPGGEVQSEPQFSEQVVPARTSEAAPPSVRSQQTAPVSARAANIMPSNEPSTFFGPTSEQDTLWSIASRLRPSPSVSVQQTLLAIYRLNPQAFENQNIHSLMPGSTLRVPSLAQVRSATTQEAVNVMNAHQARLNQTTARPVAPVQIAAPQPQPTPAAQPATPATTATPAAPDATPAPVTRSDVDKVEQQIASSDSEMLALEEKNHRLRLMLAEMQSEVDTLKNELGDENRIRSEVEKLLDEQRSKQQAEQKLAPSTWDQILSNGWLVGLMALIPGLAIAFLVLMLLNRRSQTDNQEQKPAEQTPPSQAEAAAVVAGDETLQSLEDDLLLDDDLFGEADDSELTFSDETAEADDTQDDIFADLDENDLDFNLEDEDGEDPFAGIDDDGDLDTDFGGNSGISVNGDEKALGLEEMERTLDQAVQEPQDDDEAVFDLSDDDSAVQDDLDTLLGENDTGEELESGMLEQSMLDDLFNSSTDEDDDLAALDFDSLLDENSLDDAKVTSDEELESLFSNIEAQADLDQLEAQSDEAALLDEMLDEDLELDIDSNSTELLDELLAESDEISAQNESDQMLDELLEQSASETADDAFDIDSDSLLDEWLEKEQESSETSEDEPEALAELDDGTEFFDELLEIEQQAQQPESEYNSTHFKNDLLDAVPDNDPLLEEFDFGDESEFSLDSDSDDAFEFSPQIEGSESEAEPAAPADEPVAPQNVSNQPEPVANEFGVPQDDDWLLDDPLGADSSGVKEIEPLSSADFMAGLEQQQQPEPEAAAEAEATPQEPELTAEASAESDPQTQEPDSQTQELDPQSEEPEPQTEDLAAQFTDTQAESEEEGFAFDDLDLPEYSEADALADSVAEPEAEAQPESSAQAEPPESVEADEAFAFDDLELPEYSEADALADSEYEAESEFIFDGDEDEALSDELIAGLEQSVEAQSEPEAVAEAEATPQEPELTAEASAESVPQTQQLDPQSEEHEPQAEDLAAQFADTQAESEEEGFAFDDLELPEYSEADALADSVAEPEAEAQPESSAQAEPPESVEADEAFAFDDLELPEYSEADALADSVAEPEAEAQPESSAQAEQPESAEADEAFAFDDLELPEYSEADALADSEYEAESEFIFDGEEDEALSDELFAELEQSFAEDAMGGESEPEPHGESENTPSPQPDKMAAREEFDEDALNALLDEQPHSDGFAFDGPIDAQTIDSAGMDIEAMLDMGGEDWNGFSLTADQQADIVDDVPEEELAAWHPEIQNQQPEVETENWGKQEDIMDFDPQQNQFMTIDELMAQVEREDMGLSPDDEELKLDVGLNEFPDVIGDISDIDVDSNAEAAGKLDLAQIYMEMNDHKGAVKLLEEAIVDGNDDIRRQAKHLIDVINGRA